jgi:PAS domain S-box-containing protein
MQYSEYACGEITIAKKHYRTPKYKTAKNSISADIIINQNKEGSITLYYFDTRTPSENMKFFLSEEKMLLKTVAERVARFTERLRMQSKLEEAERFFRTIFEEANDGIIIHDDKGKIIMVNDAMQRMTGYSFEELASLGINKLISKPDLSIFLETLAKKTDASNMEKRRRFETQLNRKNSQLLDVEISVRQLHSSQYPSYVQSMFRDISRDKMIRNNIQSYTRKVIQVQEEERKRISRELHDDTAQALVSLGMDMDNLINRKNSVLDSTVAENLNDHLKRLNEIIRGVEHISQDLRPPMLELLGITEALKLLTHVISDRYSVTIDFKVIGNPRPLSTEKEITIFRVTQEALFNVGKHANATSAVVEITFAKDKIGLEIHDDGCGFVLPDDTDNLILSGKLGLIGILERVQLINGVVSVESKPSTGTTISVELPGD